MKNKIFLDTSFSIALSIVKDDYHERAVHLSRQLEEQRVELITTRAVMLEIGNALAKRRF